MSQRVDPSLLPEIKTYGAINPEACFNCGTCTATCPLASDEHAFPRSTIRLLQLGLRDKLLESTDPWLCYYCGDCSASCPRGAEPGETMMATRRWLTAQYDWTGLARKFYTSKLWEAGSMLVVGVFIVLMFALFHGPVVSERVELNTFAPASIIHLLDGIMAASLSFFLLSNISRMYRRTLLDGKKVRVPIRLYVTEAWNLVYHFGTQAQFSKCEGETKRFWQKPRWRNHWFLVSGYVLMFTLVVAFLPWFQTDNIYPLYHPQRWLGYYATVVLLYGAADILWSRIKKENQMHRFSHLSDWIFPSLLLSTALTGILLHTFRYLGLPLATYITYVAHLAVAVPMLTLEVPFGKWSHLAYRPFAIYFERLREKATLLERESLAKAQASAG